MSNSSERLGTTAETAGRRAAIAMCRMAIAMHRASCRHCKHGGSGCDQMQMTRRRLDELVERTPA